MGDPSKDKPPTPPAIHLGLGLWAISLLWWFFYYAQYGGPFALIGLKLACVGVTTSECAFFQSHIRGTMPRYVPVFWYAGMAALAFGVHQLWQNRRK